MINLDCGIPLFIFQSKNDLELAVLLKLVFFSQRGASTTAGLQNHPSKMSSMKEKAASSLFVDKHLPK